MSNIIYLAWYYLTPRQIVARLTDVVLVWYSLTLRYIIVVRQIHTVF